MVQGLRYPASCDPISCDSLPPIARYPRDNRAKCDTLFLTQPLRCDRAFLVGQEGYGSDSLGHPEQRNATVVLLHLSCDKSGLSGHNLHWVFSTFLCRISLLLLQLLFTILLQWATAFYANKTKTEMCQSCLKHLKNEIPACKTRCTSNINNYVRPNLVLEDFHNYVRQKLRSIRFQN